MNIFKELEKLRIPHKYCEDSWYSCPKAQYGCTNDLIPKNECNCGADRRNAILDNIINHLRFSIHDMRLI